MKQVECNAFGSEPWNNVVVVDRDPVPVGPGEIRVAVKARPINPADLLLLEGRHLFRPTLPAVVGIEGAGVIVEVGPGVTLTAGTLVAIPSGGTWREQVTMPAANAIVLPAGTDVLQACMLSVNPFTAAGLLEDVAAGSWVIQNAGTSSIARLITRLAHRRGVHTISVVRSLERASELLALGADAVLLDGPDLTSEVDARTTGARIVRGLDAVSGAGSGRLFSCIDDGGELVAYGLLADDEMRLPAAQVVFRDVAIRGFSRLRSFGALSLERRRTIEGELLAMLADGVLSTDIEATYPLVEVAAALRHQLRPGRRGKIVLVS